MRSGALKPVPNPVPSSHWHGRAGTAVRTLPLPATFCRAKRRHRGEAAGERLANLQEESNRITDSGAERLCTSGSLICSHLQKTKDLLLQAFHGASRTRTDDLLGAIQKRDITKPALQAGFRAVRRCEAPRIPCAYPGVLGMRGPPSPKRLRCSVPLQGDCGRAGQFGTPACHAEGRGFESRRSRSTPSHANAGFRA